MVDGQPVCRCQRGFVPAGAECVPQADCKQVGLECAEDGQCCHGVCLRHEGEPSGYCSMEECRCSTDCVNHSDDGCEMCCQFIGDEGSMCMKIAQGYACSDEPYCGEPCAGGQCDRCLDCVADMDGNGRCTHVCQTDADCADCPELGSSLRCLKPLGRAWDRRRYCLPWEPDGRCESARDCPPNSVCTPYPTRDGRYLEGLCTRYGDLVPGAVCDDQADPSDLLREERCMGFYCFDGQCSEVCLEEGECPPGMACLDTEITLPGPHAVTIGMCRGP